MAKATPFGGIMAEAAERHGLATPQSGSQGMPLAHAVLTGLWGE